ncbi:MAG: hypothetical protein SAJ12_18100 [Jaaginema sp. PMC 1079.18]|nr:hypothetical protein [Jaaginema sp. PMC 1080.18]MEC4852897.1 hypothetical protein [Jaaginema sp. PMC 1079.18]MEC4868603.1 hypothetical protein [Jaaginema sp. PMC 1078.18]
MQDNNLFNASINSNPMELDFASYFATSNSDTLSNSQALDGLIFAQVGNVEDPNVIGQMQNAFSNFVETGQIWALIIGLVIGYGFRSLLPS